MIKRHIDSLEELLDISNKNLEDWEEIDYQNARPGQPGLQPASHKKNGVRSQGSNTPFRLFQGRACPAPTLALII